MLPTLPQLQPQPDQNSTARVPITNWSQDTDLHLQGRTVPQPWNPQALLNPRKNSAPASNTIRRDFPPPQKANSAASSTADLVFQFSSPSDPNTATPSTRFPSTASTPVTDDHPSPNFVPGVGHTIERMSAVQERPAVQHHKRRKIDTPEADPKAFQGRTGGGILGAYVQEKQKEGQNGQNGQNGLSTAGQTVDLTSGTFLTLRQQLACLLTHSR